MPKKVLMFGWEFPPAITGGLGMACYGITKGLANNGIDITFVMPSANEKEFSHLNIVDASKVSKVSKLHNTHVYKIDSPIFPYANEEEYFKFMSLYLNNNPTSGTFSSNYGKDIFKETQRYATTAETIAQSENFDIIHCHDWMTAQAGIEAKKATGLPLVMHVHATEMDRTLGNPDQRIYDLEKDGMLLADKIIAVSERTKLTILKYYPIDENKIVVVHNAIEQLKNPINFKSKVFKKDKIVLFLGRMTMMKGPEYFLKAAQRALEINPNIKFVMGGTGDSLKKTIDESIKLNIAKNVLFLGFYSPTMVDRICSSADLFIMPSVSEPFGIVPLEAVRNKIPVIISKSSGVSEVLPNALKVDFWDIDEMTNKMLAVLKYKPLHTQLRRHALDDIKNLTWDNQTKEITHVYNSLYTNIL